MVEWVGGVTVVYWVEWPALIHGWHGMAWYGMAWYGVDFHNPATPMTHPFHALT